MDYFKNPPPTEKPIPKPDTPLEEPGRDYLKAWREAYANSDKYTEHWDEKKELKTLGGKVVELIPVEVGDFLEMKLYELAPWIENKAALEYLRNLLKKENSIRIKILEIKSDDMLEIEVGGIKIDIKKIFIEKFAESRAGEATKD